MLVKYQSLILNRSRKRSPNSVGPSHGRLPERLQLHCPCQKLHRRRSGVRPMAAFNANVAERLTSAVHGWRDVLGRQSRDGQDGFRFRSFEVRSLKFKVPAAKAAG